MGNWETWRPGAGVLPPRCLAVKERRGSCGGEWACGGVESIYIGSLGDRCQDESLRAGEFLGRAGWGKWAWMASLGERAGDAATVKTFAELAGVAEPERSFCHPSTREMRTGAWLHLCITSF